MGKFTTLSSSGATRVSIMEGNPLKEGDLGSVTRRKFDEPLPHLNKAYLMGRRFNFVSSHESKHMILKSKLSGPKPKM